MRYDLVVRSRRAVLPDGTRAAAVAVSGPVIAAVEDYRAPLEAGRDVDLGDLPLLPGLVDTHVHVNEPGRTEWEGFATATRAAAVGGVTTICDMPLNSLPPTTSVAALEEKRAAAAGKCWVDVAFWGGAVPGNEASLRPLHEAGVVGFKCFLLDSGVPEFPPLDAAGLRTALGTLAEVDALLIAHAEDAAEIKDMKPGSGRDFGSFVASRPPVAERRAIEKVISAAAATGARAHIVHLSAAECVAMISGAKAAGIRLTAETCPHYLYFAAEQVPDGATEFKSCPPIRDAVNREALWRGLEAGVIDCVVSDHSPCPPELKAFGSGDFGAAWGGIASLQLGLSVVWTAARRRGRTLDDIAGWMASAPAALAGLPAKGRLAAGCDADLVAFDPDETFIVDPATLRHRHPVTPYAGKTLTGRVRQTWLRGTPLLEDAGETPVGRLQSRG
ncbi:MAG TPA: allantoinase AllB [Streptosporangiaceae bacterium]|nr:allantoinase AllB [Streptosporangiaceae bacterium]